MLAEALGDAFEEADSLRDGVGSAGALTELVEAGDGVAAGSSDPEQAARVSIVAAAAVIASGLPNVMIEMVMSLLIHGAQFDVQVANCAQMMDSWREHETFAM